MKLSLTEWLIIGVIVLILGGIVWSHSVRLNESERLLAECLRSNVPKYTCESDDFQRRHPARTTVYVR